MKNKILLTFVTFIALCGLTVNAAFSKENVYTQGQFTDVEASAWYAEDTANVYEVGLMEGRNEALFSPDGTVTVAEGVTIASRANSLYYEKAIEETEGTAWYDMYVAYAKDNGLFEGLSFDSYDREITRFEMAVLIANSFEGSYFEKINNVTKIPDVAQNDENFEKLLLLYNAGVVMGSNEYGVFNPQNPIKRCEVAAIINRVVFPESRLQKTLSEVPAPKEAFFLIDDDSLISNIGGKTLSGSWNYDNRYTMDLNTQGGTTSTLIDGSKEGYTAINRRFDAQSNGVMTFETSISVGSAVNGVHIYFENTDESIVLDIFSQNNVFNVKTLAGTFESETPINSGVTNIRNVANLDKKTAVLYVNEKKALEYSLGEFKDITKITYSTGVPEVLSYTPETSRLFMNYAVVEDYDSGCVPADFVSEGASIAKISTYHSLYFEKTGKSTKYFDDISGKFVAEAYVYAPEKQDSAYVEIANGNNKVLRVDIGDGKLTSGDFAMDIKHNIWQTIHFEGDTSTGKAQLFVNGRVRTTLDFDSFSINNITIGVDVNTGKEGTTGVYFDDLMVYAAREYDDYCPEPVPVSSDDYLLLMSVCSLWREGTHKGWDYVAPYDEPTPLLGFYDEGIPEVADWEIKQMVEHGIDAQQFCWFVQGNSKYMLMSPQKDGKLKDALHNGYFYAKYKDMLDYCILFENDSVTTKMTLDEFKTYIWDFWVEYYLTDPSYLKINNKPVLQIYQYEQFETMLGGTENVKAAISFMKEDIKKYGLNGLILMFSNAGTSEGVLKAMKTVGADGVSPYAYMQQSYDPGFLKSEYEAAVRNANAVGDIAFIPTIATGRNIMGWEDVRTPLSTVEEHAQVLRFAKDALNNQSDVNELIEARMIYFSTWNEFGEGHWLAPSGLNGYGYADEWRKAFTNAPEAHEDIVPTESQKARIGHMYNDYRTPIRSQFLEESPKPENVLYKMDFNDDFNVSALKTYRIDRDELYVKDGLLNIVPTATDSQTTFYGLDLNADEIKVIKIRMKADVADKGSIFFDEDGSTADTFTAAKQVSFLISEYEKFTDIYIYPTTNEGWKGTIRKLRIDFVDKINPCQIDYIEFLGLTEAQKAREIYVDYLKLENFNYENMWEENDELYIAGQPMDGFYSSLNFYHEWNRFTGKLFVKTPNNTEFNFTVGSDTVVINGEEIKLAKPFYTFNGIPVIPVKFVLDQSGVEYKETNGKLEIFVRGINIPEIVANRKFGIWDFELAGDDENWKPSGCTVSVTNGNLQMVSTVATFSSTGYDPGITIKNLEFNADDYKQIKIRMQYTYLGNNEGVAEHKGLTIYFTTDKDKSESEKLTVKINLADGVDDGDGYKIYTFDLENSEVWKDTIKSIRFDPTNNNGVYTVDYIHLIEK